VGERPHTQHKNKHRTADRCSRHNDTTVLWFFQYDIGYAWKGFLPQELLQNLNKFAQCELPSAFSVLASMKKKYRMFWYLSAVACRCHTMAQPQTLDTNPKNYNEMLKSCCKSYFSW
jgi:hypothetical protein